MKKNLILTALSTVGMMALLTACNKETELTPARSGKLITITASQDEAGTRVAHTDADDDATGAAMSVAWANGDAFALFKGTSTSKTFTIDSGEAGKTKATFTGEAPAGDGTYYAFYPAGRLAKADTDTWDDCVFDMRGQVQKGARNRDHLSDFHYMKAEGSDYSDMNFTHQVAILKFVVTLPDGENPRTLTVRTPNKADVVITRTAKGSVDTKDYDLPMELKDGDGTAAKYSAFTAYMAILPTTFTPSTDGDGFVIAITTLNGKIYSYKQNSGKTYLPGKVYDIELKESNLSTAEYTISAATTARSLSGEGTVAEPYLIKNAANMKYFLLNWCDSDGGGKEFKVIADIDMGGHVSTNGYRQMWGKLEGNGKAITNMSTSFLQLIESTGTVSNLSFSGEATATGNSFGMICEINKGVIDGCTVSAKIEGSCSNVGAICGNNTDIASIIRNCKVLSSTIQGAGNVGAICGTLPNGEIINCYSDDCTLKGSNNGNRLGGICGFVDINGKIHTSTTNKISFKGTDCKTGSLVGENSGHVFDCCNGAAPEMGSGSLVGIKEGCDDHK